ncbi:MAG: acyltransferase [Bacteroidales bacterium]|nr:acyltransferase [Bacteroidales bacterium]
MIILLIALVFILLRKSRRLGCNPEYLSRTETDSWKGFFAVIILFSHMLSCLKGLSNPFDTSFTYIIRQIGQMMVVPFLFFSGYGIMESYKNKEGYRDTFLKRRFLPVLLHFEIAVALFLVLDLSLSEHFPVRNYILCWTGWESIGNSNWFVFDILMLYLISFAAFHASGRSPMKVAIVSAILTLSLWAVLRYGFPDKGAHWHNTLWTFPLGMVYSLYKSKIETLLAIEDRAPRNITWTILGLLLLFVICSMGRSSSFIYNFKSCFFALFIVALSMRLRIGNKALVWLGKNCFSIYILQRLPMNFLSHFGMNIYNPYLFAAISIVSTLLLAWGFTLLTNLLDRHVLKVK